MCELNADYYVVLTVTMLSVGLVARAAHPLAVVKNTVISHVFTSKSSRVALVTSCYAITTMYLICWTAVVLKAGKSFFK